MSAQSGRAGSRMPPARRRFARINHERFGLLGKSGSVVGTMVRLLEISGLGSPERFSGLTLGVGNTEADIGEQMHVKPA